MASKQDKKGVRGAKGDPSREKRLAEALRANLLKRKAQLRGRKDADEGEAG